MTCHGLIVYGIRMCHVRSYVLMYVTKYEYDVSCTDVLDTLGVLEATQY